MLLQAVEQVFRKYDDFQADEQPLQQTNHTTEDKV
jgi:hypothetical protein